MRFKLFNLTFLFLFIPLAGIFSQNLEYGPYNVGFKYYGTYDDSSRIYVLNQDTISRPLLIHFWYPSDENTSDSCVVFKNYIDLISQREDFNKPSSEVDENSYNFINAYSGFAKQHFGLDTILTTIEILNSPVKAKYGPAIAESKEKFPLIVYAPSNSKSAVQNHIICEFLASYGYMVISVGSAGVNSLNRKNDHESIMAQVYDMEFILDYIEDSLKIKYAGLGLMGFSTGGLATTLFQMRNKETGAVFSMDGSQEYGHYPTLFKSDDFNLKKTNVPYCALVNNFKDFSIYPYFNSIVSSNKYMYRMPYLNHNGFVSYWRFFDLCSSNSDENKFCTSYDYICSAAVVFFNNYLKSGKKSKERFKPNLPNKEYIEQITDDNSMTAQLGNIVLKDSIEKALSFLNNNQKIFTNKENEINILSRLIRDSDADAAINILLWNVQYHPNSWQTLFELAKSYQVNEEFSMAKKTLLRAKEIDPENKEIISFQEEIYKSEK